MKEATSPTRVDLESGDFTGAVAGPTGEVGRLTECGTPAQLAE